MSGPATGDSASKGAKKQDASQSKSGGQAEPQTVAPQNSVDGQPSTASDNGSASAVAHRSVAQPGAPEGTLPQSSPKGQPPAPPSPQH